MFGYIYIYIYIYIYTHTSKQYIYIYIYIVLHLYDIEHTLVSILILQVLFNIDTVYMKPTAMSSTCISYTF